MSNTPISSTETPYAGGSYEVLSPDSISFDTFEAGATVQVDSGAMATDTVLNASSMLDEGSIAATLIENGGTLEIAASATNPGGVDFTGPGSGTIKIDASAPAPTSVNGFGAGDEIQLLGIGFGPSDTLTTSGNTATVHYGVNSTATYDINGASSLNLVLVDVGGSDTIETSPIAIGGVASGTIADSGVVQPFASATVTDSEASPSDTATITLMNGVNPAGDANGTLSGANLTETAPGSGVYTLTAATPANIQSELRSLVFTPAALPPGGTATTTFDLQVQNTSSSISSTNNAAAITVNAARPAIGLTVHTSDSTPVDPFATLAVSDSSESDTVTITLTDAATGAHDDLDGVLNYGTLVDGTVVHHVAGSGVYTFTNDASHVSADLQSLVFTPVDHQVPVGQSVTTDFNVAVTNASNQTSVVGVSVVAMAVPAMLSISGTVADQMTTDAGRPAPFSGVTISDPNNAAAETVTITLTNDQENTGLGTLSLLDGDLKGGTGGIYSLSGSAAQVTTDLQNIVFAPADHQVAPGDSVTTSFALSVTDNVGESASDTTASVVAQAVDNGPSIGGTLGTVDTSDIAAVRPFAGGTITDPDFHAQDAALITLSDGGTGPGDGYVEGTLSLGSTFDSANLVSDGSGRYLLYPADPATLTSELQSLIFTPAAGVTTNTDLALTVADAGNVLANSGVSVLATQTQPAPIIGVAVATDDMTAVNPFTAAIASDFNLISTDTVTIRLQTTGGASVPDTTGMLAGTGLTEISPGTYVLAATGQTSITSELQALTFTPAAHVYPAGQTQTTDLAVSIADGTDTPTTYNVLVNVQATDTAPTITATPAAPADGTYFFDNTPIALFNTASVTDVDYSPTDTVTITLNNASNGSLRLNNVLLTPDSVVNQTATYTLSGLPGTLDADLAGLTYVPTMRETPPGTAEITTVTVGVADAGGKSTSLTPFDLTVYASDAGPTISSPPSDQSANTTDAPHHIFGTVTVADLDFQAQDSATITLVAGSSDANGTLTGTGLQETQPGSGVYTISATDPATLTTDLQSIVFNPNTQLVAANASFTTSFALSVTDSAVAPLTPITVSAPVFSVTTTQINTPPTITGTVPAGAVTNQTPAAPFATATINDPDVGARETVTITLTDGTNSVGDAHGMLAESSAYVGAGFVESSSAPGTYTMAGTPGAVTSALEALVFTPNGYAYPIGTINTTYFAISANDGIAPPATNTATYVTDSVVNTVPSIAGTIGGESGLLDTPSSPVDPFSNVTIADPDLGAAETVTITVLNSSNAATDANGTFATVTGLQHTPGTGVYTLTGTPSEVTHLLDSELAFTPTQHQATPGQNVVTTFSLAVSDGLAPTQTASGSISVGAVAAQPTLTGLTASQIYEGPNFHPFAAAVLNDANYNPSDSITITATGGTLSGGGVTGTEGNYTIAAQSLSAAQAALRSVVFTRTVNHAYAPGATEQASLNVAVADYQTSPSVPVTVTYTEPSATPSFSGITSSPQLTDDLTTVTPFSNVSITDADYGPTDTATITFNGANGTLSSNSEALAGSNGSYTLTASSPTALSTDLSGLVFTPTPQQVAVGNTVTTSFTVAYHDGTETATNSSTSVVATGTDAAPTIGGTVAGQLSMDAAPVNPFSTVTVGDELPNMTDTATVTLSLATGALSNLDGGTLSADGLTYTVSGDAADVQAALRGLTYTPTASQVQPGPNTNTLFALEVGNSAGNSFNTNTTVISQARDVSVPANAVYLHGASGDYTIANNNGAMYVADSVAGRDGAQTLPGSDNEVLLSDGVGIFDPTGTAENVARLYQAALGRQADVSGLDSYTAAIDGNGESLTAVANNLISSPEFMSDYGSQSDSAFIQQLYQNALGRSADPSGLQFYQSMLSAGMSRAQVLVNVADSQEGIAHTMGMAGDRNTAEVTRLYDGILGRAADSSGSANYTSALAGGQTSTQVAQSLLNSTEYQNNFGQLSDSAFVSNLYQNALGRAADAGGLQNYVGLLGSGTSRAQVAVAISDSLEGRVHTASQTHDGWVFLGNGGGVG